MSKQCLIITGGEFAPFAPPVEGEYVIACDRGYEHARRAGIRPDLVVGDLDSCRVELESGVPLRRLPVEKDDTDTLLCMKKGLAMGLDDFAIVGGFGGRLDHLLANLQSLAFAAARGASVRIESPDTEIRTLRNGSLRLPRREGYSLSVFAVDGVCRGLCIRGAKYTLEDAELRPDFPLGASNEWSAEEAEITLREGTLLIVESRIP